MKITIQTPDPFDQRRLTPIRKSVAKLEKIYPPIIEAHVLLKSVNDNTGRNSMCEIKLEIPGKDLFASSAGDTFEIAVHDTIAALKHQVDRIRTSQDNQRVTPL